MHPLLFLAFISLFSAVHLSAVLPSIDRPLCQIRLSRRDLPGSGKQLSQASCASNPALQRIPLRTRSHEQDDNSAARSDFRSFAPSKPSNGFSSSGKTTQSSGNEKLIPRGDDSDTHRPKLRDQSSDKWRKVSDKVGKGVARLNPKKEGLARTGSSKGKHDDPPKPPAEGKKKVLDHITGALRLRKKPVESNEPSIHRSGSFYNSRKEHDPPKPPPEAKKKVMNHVGGAFRLPEKKPVENNDPSVHGPKKQHDPHNPLAEAKKKVSDQIKGALHLPKKRPVQRSEPSLHGHNSLSHGSRSDSKKQQTITFGSWSGKKKATGKLGGALGLHKKKAEPKSNEHSVHSIPSIQSAEFSRHGSQSIREDSNHITPRRGLTQQEFERLSKHTPFRQQHLLHKSLSFGSQGRVPPERGSSRGSLSPHGSEDLFYSIGSRSSRSSSGNSKRVNLDDSIGKSSKQGMHPADFNRRTKLIKVVS